MNSGYTSADIYAMQKEAEKRVFEMQRRARQTLLYDEDEDSHADRKKTVSEHEIINVKNEPNKTSSKEENKNTLSSLINLIGEDAERAMLTMLLILLVEEKADESLILILLYLIAD